MGRPFFAALVILSCAPPTGENTGGGSAVGGGSAAGGGNVLGTCAELPVACGTLGTGGGATPLACGDCFFDRAVLGVQGVENAAAMVNTSGGLVVAWAAENTGSTRWVLSRELADGGFESEDFAPPSTPSNLALGLAVAPDGTTYIAYPDDGAVGVWLATSVDGGAPDGGRFINEPIDPSGAWPTVALDPAGQPRVAYVKNVAGPHPGLFTARRGADGGWELTLHEVVDAGLGTVGQPQLLFDATGAQHLVYRVLGFGPEGGLHHESGGVVTIAPGPGASRTPVAAAFDDAGRLHALWSLSALYVSHSVFTAGGWSDLATWTFGAHQLGAMAIGPHGQPAMVFHSRASLELFAYNGHGYAQQSLQSCSEGSMAVAFDGAQRLRVASGCGAMSVLTPVGYYPVDHASRCAQLTTTVCGLACGACADNDCCVSIDPGKKSCSNNCPSNVGGAACFNAFRPDSLLDDCLAESASLACTTPATSGVELHTGACHELFLDP